VAFDQGGPAVLLIHWRRHRLLLPQITALRESGVSRFYIACDGPRGPSDIDVFATQGAIVDMQERLRLEGLQVEICLSSSNLGCERGVLSAIDWFFENESEGIILEDDCLPGIDFVMFVSTMLNRYREDQSVFCVSGENSTKLGFKDSYGFAAHPLIWGWATWRDRWSAYSQEDRNLATWQDVRKDGAAIQRVFPNFAMRTVWSKRLDDLLFNSLPDTWDYQLTYFCRANARLCVVPTPNLVKNIGDEADGTHITGPTSRTGQRAERVFCLRHPRAVKRSRPHEFLFFWRDEGSRKVLKLLPKLFKSRHNVLFVVGALLTAAFASLYSAGLRTVYWFRVAPYRWAERFSGVPTQRPLLK